MKKLTTIVILLFLVTTLQAQTEKMNTVKRIEVSGSAELELVPDEIFVNFTLQEFYDNQKKKHDIDEIQTTFLNTCAKFGITKDRIQIQSMSGFNGNNWYWRKQKREQPDLLANTVYIIKFSNAADIDKLVNNMDDRATNQLYISKTSHSKMDEYKRDLKIKALQAAKNKATYLCEAVGEKVGQALIISEFENNFEPQYAQPKMYTNMAMDMAAGSANEGVDFQKIIVRSEIKATFAIQ
ncbi:MAG: SIMPL domain-containing protein [Bacteroidia bacterium]|nr:SIMPL domain-containing protein [Bacteroidia bacterium]